MTIASALAGLLEVVENDRRVRCAALLNAADAQASAQLDSARQENRRRLRAALQAERAKAKAQVAAAVARLQAEQRRAQLRHDAMLLAAASALLPPALQAIWQDDARRREWLTAALQKAAATLPRHDWLCQHPPSLSAVDVDWLLARAGDLGIANATCESDPDIDAGIAIVVRSDAGTVRLDATTAGLLADRAWVDGRLLQFLGAP
jgi:hypothetical protein